MYIFGHELHSEGYVNKSVEELESSGIKDSTCLLVIKESGKNLYRLYTGVKELILNGNRIILVIEERLLDEYKLICMLMSSYRQFDIYTINGVELLLSEQYVSKLEYRRPNSIEVQNFIGNGVMSYAEINVTFMEILNAINNKDLDKLVDIIDRDRNIIQESILVMDYLKYIIDNMESNKLNDLDTINGDDIKQKEIDKLTKIVEVLKDKLDDKENKIETITDRNSTVEKLLEELKTYKSRLEIQNKDLVSRNNVLDKLNKELKEDLDKLVNEQSTKDGVDGVYYKEELERYKRDVELYANRIKGLENKINNSGPILNTYNDIQTSLIKCKVKSIIYMKEISYVCYVNSLVTNMVEVLGKLNKLRVKLIIYDYKSSFLSIYRPISIVSSVEYINNRDSIVNKLDKIVVVEPNQAIMEDILKADYDVVIVYDRLKQNNDLVTGNNVYKYWVMNSMSDIHSVSQSIRIDSKHIITRPMVKPEALSINAIKDYKAMSPTAKIAAYLSLQNGGNNNNTLFNIIFSRTNVENIGGRE